MERVLANKANALTAAGHEVIIVTTDQKGRKNAIPMDPSIRRVDLEIGYEDNNGASFLNKLIHYPAKKHKHRKELTELLMQEKADIVDSMFCGDEGFLPKIKDGSKKVLEIHFSRYKRLQYGRKGIWAVADRWRSAKDLDIAAGFDRFVVLTEEDRSYWEADAAKAGKHLTNLRVIPNARTFRCSMPAELNEHLVIAVGRYNVQKHLDALLEAWKLADRGDWMLWLVGDGEDREALEHKAQELGINGSVRFGSAESSNIVKVYQGASILAMSSRYEGLPMVLIEAQAAGVPVVSFACKCGPKDVITDGIDGYIVEEGDIAALAAKLSEMMHDDKLRKSMGAAAFEASERFDEEIVMRQWHDMFNELTNA